MASNRLISFAALFCSILFITDFISHKTNGTELIDNISCLLTTNHRDESASLTLEDTTYYTRIHKDAGNWIFEAIFSSLLSKRGLTRKWKPLLSSYVLMVVFRTMPLPTPTSDAAALCFLGLTLCHAYFMVHWSLKLIAMPILEEKFVSNQSEESGKQARKAELTRVCWTFTFLQFFAAAMQFWMIYLSKESYDMRVVVGNGVLIVNMIKRVNLYELVAILVLIYDNRKAVEAAVSSSESVASKLLSDESLP